MASFPDYTCSIESPYKLGRKLFTQKHIYHSAVTVLSIILIITEVQELASISLRILSVYM